MSTASLHCSRSDKTPCNPTLGHAKVASGAEYTLDTAVATPTVSGVLSRPNTLFFGRDGATRKDARTAVSVYSTSRPPAIGLNTVASGPQSHTGARTMTTVNSTATPVSGTQHTSSTLLRFNTIEAALRALLAEVTPGIHPYSSDSNLPAKGAQHEHSARNY